jgi:hypothetical protein
VALPERDGERVSDQDQLVWTADDVFRLGVRTTVPIAGQIIAGLCKDESYRMVARGEFPVPVVKVGKNRLVVPVAPIIELLRIKPDEDPADLAPRKAEDSADAA